MIGSLSGVGKTVRLFCRNYTNVCELIVIRCGGWIVETVWIDSEDIFRLSSESGDAIVKNYEFGTLPVNDRYGNKTDVPCLYVDVD